MQYVRRQCVLWRGMLGKGWFPADGGEVGHQVTTKPCDYPGEECPGKGTCKCKRLRSIPETAVTPLSAGAECKLKRQVKDGVSSHRPESLRL